MSTSQSRTCGSMIHHEILMETVPEYRQTRLEIERASQAYESNLVGVRGELPLITIPVVVHVVFNRDIENISDEQIHSQIRILNEDYRATNTDIDSVPEPFKPLVADAKIEFELAKKDPNGQLTNGITRTFTDKTSFNVGDDEVKFTSTGGKDAWPSDKYLNIWVCTNLISRGRTILGYAQFPGGPSATDGVAIGYTFFGDTGTATAPFNKGRTATHEVGHWLNLRHIWGDEPMFTDPCSFSDFVDDTPNQADPNFNTPDFPSPSCGNDEQGGDMFMNYMDYVDDVAMFMFSQGQVTRMRATLDGPRASIKTSPALTTS